MLLTEVIKHWWTVVMTAQDKEHPSVCSAATFKQVEDWKAKTMAI